MAKVIAINISGAKGEKKHPIEKGYFKENHGLEGDSHAGDTKRQVSLFGKESIDKMKMVDIPGFCTEKFVSNLTTEGIILFKIPIGTKIQIGETLMELTQIGKQCHEGCAIRKLVGECIMPLEGVFAKVLISGNIHTGDELIVL